MILENLNVIERCETSTYINAVDRLVDAHFMENESGEIECVPHYARIYKRIIACEFITGITLEETDKGNEIKVFSNEALDAYIEMVYDQQYFKDICEDAKSIVEFKKQKMLKSSSMDTFMDAATKFISSMESRFSDVDLTAIPELGKLGEAFSGMKTEDIVTSVVKSINKDNKKNVKVVK